LDGAEADVLERPGHESPPVLRQGDRNVEPGKVLQDVDRRMYEVLASAIGERHRAAWIGVEI
jgi:hypothetical protein